MLACPHTMSPHERRWWCLHPLRRDSAVSPCFHGAWLSSTGISHHDLLPHTPWILLSTVNSCPRPGIAPWFLNSSSQPLRRPGELHPCSGYVWLQQGLSDSHSFRRPQVSCFTLGLKCFSSDSDSCPAVVIRPLLQFPHLLRAGPVLLTLLFFPLVPSSYEFCVGLYSLFHWSGPPAHLSCCSACTSVSEAVFLMYP